MKRIPAGGARILFALLTAITAWIGGGSGVALGSPAASLVLLLVVDTSGAPIAGATVEVLDPGSASRHQVQTSVRGEASISVPERPKPEASISASGFAPAVVQLPSSAEGPLRVVLSPAPFAASVAVVAESARVEVPASTTTVTSETMQTSAAGALDDLLRSTPGFSLFRRGSSRTANPTTQGVTLRGVSASGAGRTLVLADAVPLNDPFGSWVYWNRIPEAAIERVDVVRGPAGDVWGTDALGGVVRLHLLDPTRALARATLEGGTQSTARASLFAAVQRNGWSLSGTGEGNRSGGAFVVASSDRGAVDVPAFSDYWNGALTGRFRREAWRGGLSASWYREQRGNGTPEQKNDTWWRQLAADAGGPALGGFWEARASGGSQAYAQTFTAVSMDRASERLTSEQDVPTDFARANGQWVRQFARHDVAMGADWRRTTAVVNETLHPSATLPAVFNSTGGRESVAAIFARGQFQLGSSWRLSAGARLDRWRTAPEDGEQLHSASLFSPRVSLSWSGTSLTAHLSAGQAYRVPTLNELYRGFRAGNVVTAANDRLRPERLTAIEAGAVASRHRWSARATLFANVLDDAIANLTVRSTPQLITRQRANSDRLRSVGAEFEATWQAWRTVTFSAQLTLTDSRFRVSLANPALAGNRVPQVPLASAGGGITWSDPRLLTLAVRTRGTSMAFDDDLNTLPLRAFGIVDLYAGRQLARSLTAFVAVENLFNVEYDVARTPLRAIGWPRSVRAGVRVLNR